MGTLLRRFLRQSVMRKGVTGKSPFWTLLGALSVLNTLRKRFGAPQSFPLTNGPIRPGEIIEIRHSGAPSRELRKERGKRAELVQSFVAAPAGRKGRKVRKKFSGTLVEELASVAGLANPNLAKLMDASKAPKRLSRRARRKLSKRTRKAAASTAKTAKRAARRAGSQVARSEAARPQVARSQGDA
jgi:hypothetical protein